MSGAEKWATLAAENSPQDDLSMLGPDLELRDIVEETEYIHKPQNHDNDDNRVENAFDGPLHGNEAVDQPKQNSDDEQRDDNIDQRHFDISLYLEPLPSNL